MDFKTKEPASQYLELLSVLSQANQKPNSVKGETEKNAIFISRSGLATRARMAISLLEKGNNVLLLTKNSEELSELKAFCTLFHPDYSVDNQNIERSLWEEEILVLPEYPNNLQSKTAWTNRLAAFYALKWTNRPRVILCSLASLLYRSIPLDFFDKRSLSIKKGENFAPELILEQAVEWGYIRTPLVNRPGEVALRGDILDIYCPGYLKPLRLEFFGDTLEDIRIFEASNQRSLAKIAEITLLPSSVVCGKDTEEQALTYWQALLKDKRLNEDDIYPLKKSLQNGAGNILAGMLNPLTSTLEDWLPAHTVYLLPSENCLKPELENAANNLSLTLEKQEQAEGIHQPKTLVMRSPEEALELIKRQQKVFFEDLLMGIEKRGLELQERKICSFKELFLSAKNFEEKNSAAAVDDTDRPWQKLITALKKWALNKRRVLLSFYSDRSRQKFLKLAEQDGIFPHLRWNVNERGVFALISPVSFGAELSWDSDLLIIGEEVLQPKTTRTTTRSATGAFKGLNRYEGLSDGDLLVHRDYGISRFGGLHRLDLGGASNDYLLLYYAGNDKVYLPVDRLSLIQRYKGGEDGVALDKLGGTAWLTSKSKAKKAIELIAQDLVEMYAYRKLAKGFRYGPLPELFREFEASFGFEETPDQIRTINEVLDDMDKDEPMDRLVCGDVGFGKTEVALRAAFRAACAGRQVAMLCPTTILAEQHYQTFRARLAAFPLNIGLLSRFVTKQKQKEVLEQASKGQVDILVGTHRLLSQDVVLPKLGLLILDEEQKFGVRHKEKMKQMKKNVDALTLTATPIPRTLQLSMSGVRELSVIETAPPERKPVATALIERDETTLRKILERELERGGQVFWVHNRIQGLERVCDFVKKLVPSARVAMAHGQMHEKVLEETMHKFWHAELDVLVCTAIVESGLDFPRANTLIVDQAQLFGLGQLYQLRGRVGRSDRQAYAVFVVPDIDTLPQVTRERMKVILEMDYLGAGFQVAMEDLRLRGAGNILGESQSGHMTRLGIDLFLELLEEAVAKLRGQPLREEQETELNLSVPAHIPENYIADASERLSYYKKLSSAQNENEMQEILYEVQDRFGVLPLELKNFVAILYFKRFLQENLVNKADIYPDKVRLTWNAEAQGSEKQASYLKPETLLPWLAKRPRTARLLPPNTLEIAFGKESLAPLVKAPAPYLLPNKTANKQVNSQVVKGQQFGGKKQKTEHVNTLAKSENVKTEQVNTKLVPDLEKLLDEMKGELKTLFI
ncbi:transcription-repair coupling factor [Desulfovibrio litoralis]|uniref:Transcription-repair-coupling factor n=1 Tax=Desulfovibrio litoralis DSM 11393 TaxID=1121455 RepID=A0A1M7RUH1_9BACT|nr:transcription-repair coupling factor [Desulfovibrio litoralis]SHN49672.1 transcription-repair coupling factor (superfamily II helicase) [Desulfovibrio litoralis DSM 11393]